MTTEIGMTNESRAVVAVFTPSTALKTEMAGVMTPSPYSNAVPKRPSRTRPAM